MRAVAVSLSVCLAACASAERGAPKAESSLHESGKRSLLELPALVTHGMVSVGLASELMSGFVPQGPFHIEFEFDGYMVSEVPDEALSPELRALRGRKVWSNNGCALVLGEILVGMALDYERDASVGLTLDGQRVDADDPEGEPKLTFAERYEVLAKSWPQAVFIALEAASGGSEECKSTRNFFVDSRVVPSPIATREATPTEREEVKAAFRDHSVYAIQQAAYERVLKIVDLRGRTAKTDNNEVDRTSQADANAAVEPTDLEEDSEVIDRWDDNGDEWTGVVTVVDAKPHRLMLLEVGF